MSSTFLSKMKELGDLTAFPTAVVTRARWGQLMRTPQSFATVLAEGQAKGLLVPLREVARVSGGVVTRANSYFLVEELPFERIPARFQITKRDLQRVAVVMDGPQTAHKIEREYLLPVIKGPERLLGPRLLDSAALRVFAVNVDVAQLKKVRAQGALAYLRRGETVDYRVSEDSLKGGIPAKRSNVRGRRPFWYSLNIPKSSGSRIVVPEHFSGRYVATLLDHADDSVVLDKLFTCECEPDDAQIVLASLNSLLAWAQYELRGRTQLGQGVLEVKKADLEGILVLNPAISRASRDSVLKSFAALGARQTEPAEQELALADRVQFDLAVATVLDRRDARGGRMAIERTWRLAASERTERAHSLDDVRAQRGRVERTATDVDAWASRLVSQLESFPDPRSFVPPGLSALREVAIIGDRVGKLRVGRELFTHGQVLSGDSPLTEKLELAEAEFVCAALARDVELRTVQVPRDPAALEQIMSLWRAASVGWRDKFKLVHQLTCLGINDPRLRAEIAERALLLLRIDSWT